MEKDRILLFIPAYNCEKQITRVLDQIDEKVLHYVTEIIVIDNRSTDGTREAVENYMISHWSLPIKLFENEENYGLGGSHKVAFDYALKNNFDYVMVLHGDDQGSIKDFLPVLKKKLYRHYDSVLGARFMLQSKLIGYSKFRTFGNLVFDFLFAAAIKQRVFDLGSGLNIYKTDTLRDRYYYRFPDNLMFNYCMVMAIGYYDQNVRFYPISWRETDQVSNVKMTNQALTVLKMLLRFIDCPTSIRGEYRDKSIIEYKAKEL